MTLFSLLYSAAIIVLCSVGLIGFGILYFLHREKKDLFLSLYFLLNLVYEVIRSISDNVPGGYIDFHSPEYLISVAIMALMTLLYYLIYADQIRSPITLPEKIILLAFTIVVFSLTAFQSTRAIFYEFLPYFFFWAACRLYRQRKEDRRSCVMFWIAVMYIVNMVLSLIVNFVDLDKYVMILRRNGGPFDILINIDFIFFVVIAAAYVDLFTSFKRYVILSKEKESSPSNTVDFTALSREAAKAYNLTKREAEVLGLLIEGSSYDEISEKLYIAGGTVKVHIHNIYKKLGISSRSQITPLLIENSAKNT